MGNIDKKKQCVTGSISCVAKEKRLCKSYAVDDQDGIVSLSEGMTAKESHLGSRLLTLTALNFLKNDKLEYSIDNSYYLSSSVVSNCQTTSQILGLNEKALDATLLVCKNSSEDVLDIRCWGDGIVVVVKDSGAIYCHTIDFLLNDPFCLNYLNNIERLQHWKYAYDKGDNQCIENKKIIQQGQTCVCTNNVINLNVANNFCHTISYSKDDVKTIGLFSKSSDSFYSKPGFKIPIIEIALRLLTFENEISSIIGKKIEKTFNIIKEEGIYNKKDFSASIMHFNN